GISRNTIRKMLKSPRPPREAPPPESAEQKLLEAAQILAAERFLIDPSVHCRRTLYLWGRARDLLLKLDRCRGAALLREIAELISGDTATTEAGRVRFCLDRVPLAPEALRTVTGWTVCCEARYG